MNTVHNAFYQTVTQLIQSDNTEKALSELEIFFKSHPDDEIALSIYGSALMRIGNSKLAIDTFKKAAAIYPNSFGAHADLAFISMKVGDNSQAIASFENATKINPEFYQAWIFLAKLYFETEEYSAATKAVDKSEKLDPLDQDYQQIQASMRADNFAGAEKIARSMLSKQPGHPRASFVLAHLASTVGAHDERANILAHSLELHPANIMLRRALIEAYEEIGSYEKAQAEAELLVKIQSNYLNHWIQSRIYGHLGMYENSLSAAEKAASYVKDNHEEVGKLDLLRGHSLKILGRREESEQAYRDCIINTPGNGAGWWGLADLKTYKFSDDDKMAMETISSNEALAMDQRCQATFALAKAFENDGDEKQAFSWYERANNMRQDIHYDPVKSNEFYDETLKAFDAKALSKQAMPAPSGPTPIFIVGMPRAGSTLIEQILASHSQIEGTMELMTLPNLERKIMLEGGRKFNKHYPQSLEYFSETELAAFGQEYLDTTAVYRTDKAYFIDKLPPNFERIGLIHKILPQAIIIDARRHPMDCGYSAFKQHFAGGHPYSYNLSHIGHYYNGYLRLMDHWDSQLPGKTLCVQYENMVRDTEATVRTLLDHIGVAFEPECLKFYENKRAVKTASSEQVRQPINAKGMGRWEAVADQLEGLATSLGEKTLSRF